MDTELTTVIGQLSIQNGQWRNNPSNQVAVRQPQAADAPGAGKGDLFIITEVQGDADNLEKMEQRLAETIRDSYYLARGSITASLRRALQAGSDLLYQRNRQVDTEQRVAGGAVVVVVSNEDAFVAQAGPSACFAILGDHIQRYPRRSVWLDEALGPEEDTVLALGLSHVVEPTLHHLRVASEDVLLLADGRLAGQLPLKDVVRAVSNGDVKASLKKLAEVAQAKSCSALLLEVVDKSPGRSGPVKISAPKSLGSLWPRRSDEAEAEPEVDEPITEALPELAAESPSESKAAAIFASTAAMAQKPLGWLGNLTGKAAPAATERPVTPPPSSPEPEASSRKETLSFHSPAEELPDEVDDEPVEMPHNSHHYAIYDDAADQAHPKHRHFSPKQMLLSIVAAVGGALRWLLGLLVRPEDEPRQAGTQAQQKASGGVPWKLLRNIAIAIPLLVALIVGINYLRAGQLREAEYQEYVTTAQSKFEQAQAVTDPAAALGLMAEAENSLVQAETIKQAQPEIADLRQQMADYTDSVTKVTRLYYLPQVRRYTDPGTTMDSLIVQGVEVYAMDTGNDRVFHHRLDDLGDALLPDDETVLMTAKGQQVDSRTVGDMLGMTWMPTGGNRQTSDLVILNSTGLLEYNPNWGITGAVLAGGEQLKLPTAVDSFFGNFYLLDPQANTLLRYLPTADGYSATPESYFLTDQQVDLGKAVDMAIDGSIYILYSDGRIGKYLGGQPEEFNLSGLDVPLNNPVAIFTAPEEEVQYLYVADAGNHRIVQLEKNGTFVQQFKPRPGEAISFSNLQDIYVDEISGRLFVLDSNNLYLGKIPLEETAPIEKTAPEAEVAPAESAPAEGAPAEAAPAEVVPVEPAPVQPEN